MGLRCVQFRATRTPSPDLLRRPPSPPKGRGLSLAHSTVPLLHRSFHHKCTNSGGGALAPPFHGNEACTHPPLAYSFPNRENERSMVNESVARAIST